MCSAGLDWQTVLNQVQTLYGNTLPPGFQLKLQLLGSAPVSSASSVIPTKAIINANNNTHSDANLIPKTNNVCNGQVPSEVWNNYEMIPPNEVIKPPITMLPQQINPMDSQFIKSKLESNGFSPRLKTVLPKIVGDEFSEPLPSTSQRVEECNANLSASRPASLQNGHIGGKKYDEEHEKNIDKLIKRVTEDIPEIKSTGYRTESGYKVFINGQTFLFHSSSTYKKKNKPTPQKIPFTPPPIFVPQMPIPEIMENTGNCKPFEPPLGSIKKYRRSPPKAASCARIRHFEPKFFNKFKRELKMKQDDYLQSLKSLDGEVKVEPDFPWETLTETVQDTCSTVSAAGRSAEWNEDEPREQSLLQAIKLGKVKKKRKQNLKRLIKDELDLDYEPEEEEALPYSIYSSEGTSCARIRPLPPSFVCARCRPYSGYRKQINWCYFMMHPERLDQYKPKKRRLCARPLFSGDNSNLVESNRLTANFVASSQMPINIQYRAYISNKGPPLFLSKSLIHGIGVFTELDVEQGRLLLEYKGEIIRNILLDQREDMYRKRGFGSYMFRIDNEYTVDATLQGSIARFINHCCDPNCQAKIINYEGAKKIVLFASRYIEQGEELSYNYKMPIEKEKVPCFCGATNCRKSLN